MLNMILLLAVTFTGSYFALKPSFAGWSEMATDGSPRFKIFENQWHKMFAIAGSAGIGVALLAYYRSEGNPYVGYIFGLMAGLLGLASWTDTQVFKVPAELSSLTKWLAGTTMLVVLLTGSIKLFPSLNPTYLPLFSFSNSFWMFAGISVAVALVGFLVAVKTKGKVLFLIGLMMLFIGSYLLGYGLLSSLAALAAGDYWIFMAKGFLLAYVFLGVAMGYDLFLPREGIGGADTTIFYTLGFAFAWWVSPYLLFVALLISFTLQLLLHLLAKPLNLGYEKEIKNGALRQSFIKARARLFRIENVATTHIARAVPFVPMLVMGSLTTLFIFL